MDKEARSRENFEFELVSHQGIPSVPAMDSRGTQRHMGALEDNMQEVTLPNYEDDDEQMPVVQAHKQQTPG
ncbi:MAG: hypothetical protein JWP00_1369 [Chloroflexi bacterium]|nr:hypothetical protein [Chloroflexota bacterium]